MAPWMLCIDTQSPTRNNREASAAGRLGQGRLRLGGVQGMDVGLAQVDGLGLERAVQGIVGNDAVLDDDLIDFAFLALVGVFVAQQRDALVAFGADALQPGIGRQHDLLRVEPAVEDGEGGAAHALETVSGVTTSTSPPRLAM